MEQNNQNNEPKQDKKKKSMSEIAQIYAVVTQGFVEMITLTLVGFGIGKYAIKQETWAAILAVIGAIIGLIIFLMLLFKLNIGGDSHGTTK
ncbi:MAG: hypothetical protein K6G28_03840 [Acholeplasmatales bacterium]|nr:hypothetical protein [Acholeplasmatales bacterium]